MMKSDKAPTKVKSGKVVAKKPAAPAPAPVIKTETPPHSMHVVSADRLVFVRVQLHKIPESLVKVEPTKTEFYLDTLKYSKKFLLQLPYPNGIKVNPEKGEALLENGVLKVRLPIISGFEEYSAERTAKKEEHKAKKSEQPTKRRAEEISVPVEQKSVPAASSSASEEAEPAPAAKRSRKEEKQVQREAKQTQKAEAAAAVEEQAGQASLPKKKKLMDQKDAMLDIASSVSSAAQEKVEERVAIAEEKEQKIAEKEAKKAESKALRQTLKDERMKEAMAAIQPAKKVGKAPRQAGEKRVSFGGKAGPSAPSSSASPEAVKGVLKKK